MALIIETGNGIAGANSYCTLTFTNTYLTSIGKSSDWTNTSTLQNAALIRSCYFMETLDWIGTKADPTFPLEWPRRNVIDKNGFYVSATGVPLQIKILQSELAVRFLNGDDPLPDQDTTGNVVKEKVDVIEIQYEKGGAEQTPSQPFIDTLMKPWVKSRSNIIVERV